MFNGSVYLTYQTIKSPICCWITAAAVGPMQDRAIDSNTFSISGAPLVKDFVQNE
jgi:hypothetical protein